MDNGRARGGKEFEKGGEEIQEKRGVEKNWVQRKNIMEKDGKTQGTGQKVKESKFNRVKRLLKKGQRVSADCRGKRGATEKGEGKKSG